MSENQSVYSQVLAACVGQHLYGAINITAHMSQDYMLCELALGIRLCFEVIKVAHH